MIRRSINEPAIATAIHAPAINAMLSIAASSNSECPKNTPTSNPVAYPNPKNTNVVSSPPGWPRLNADIPWPFTRRSVVRNVQKVKTQNGAATKDPLNTDPIISSKPKEPTAGCDGTNGVRMMTNAQLTIAPIKKATKR